MITSLENIFIHTLNNYAKKGENYEFKSERISGENGCCCA